MIMEAESLRPIGPAAEYGPHNILWNKGVCVIVSVCMYYCTVQYSFTQSMPNLCMYLYCTKHTNKRYGVLLFIYIKA